MVYSIELLSVHGPRESSCVILTVHDSELCGYSGLHGKLLVQWSDPNRDRLRQVTMTDTAPFRQELEKIDALAADGFPADTGTKIISLEKGPSCPSGRKANPSCGFGGELSVRTTVGERRRQDRALGYIVAI